MLLLIPIALAQDCQHRPIAEAFAADWMTTTDEYRDLARQKRHAEMEFIKELLARRMPAGAHKVEIMTRLGDCYLREGRALLLDGDRPRPWRSIRWFPMSARSCCGRSASSTRPVRSTPTTTPGGSAGRAGRAPLARHGQRLHLRASLTR